METALEGAFVISWSQTDLDGLESAPMDALDVGAVWSWRGEAVRVDGTAGVVRPERMGAEDAARRQMALQVRQLVGRAVGQAPGESADIGMPDRCFVVTNGAQSHTVTIIDTGPGSAPLLMFLDTLPPRDIDLWVVDHNLDAPAPAPMADPSGGVICFTPGTWISTPDGARRIEDLREGDRVQTRDSGAQEICWVGARRMSGARLFAIPDLRPVRIGAGALGIDRPDRALLVSPGHRMLVRGAAARALFDTPEVLVSARDLVNGGTVTVDESLREVTYIHLLLPDHQILWANGVETESFHPASADLATLGDDDRRRLLDHRPELAADPRGYGRYARRNLTRGEAARLRSEAA